MEKLKEVGQRIRDARRAVGLSQSELAEKLNISPAYMSDIENGKTNVGLEIFMGITEALQVSADFLLQTDTPLVKDFHRSSMDALLSRCSASELERLTKIVRQIQEYAGKK